MSAVLSRAQNQGLLAAHKAAAFLDDLAALAVIVDMQGASRILTDIHRIATTYRLTSYDAAYLELALHRNLPLATLDEELLDACKDAGVKLFEPGQGT